MAQSFPLVIALVDYRPLGKLKRVGVALSEPEKKPRRKQKATK